MMDVMRSAHGETVVQVSGAFDAVAASRLAAWLSDVPSADAVVVDLTHARPCEDSGLARLARALEPRSDVVLRGLNRHQARMLEYLGWRGSRGGGAPGS